MEYLGKISGDNRDIYQTFMHINIKIKENLVVLMYDALCTHTQVNGCRKYLFSKLNHIFDQCPPTRNAPEQHILRTMPQSYLWSKSAQLKENSFTVTEWDGTLTSVGMSIHCRQHCWSFQSMQNNAKKIASANICAHVTRVLVKPTPYHVLSFADVTVFRRADITSSMMKFVKIVFCLIVHM